MDKPDRGRTSDEVVISSTHLSPRVITRPAAFTAAVTFSAPYPHDCLEADLPGEVALQVPLELLHLSRVVDVMEGGVVKDAACRVLGDTR